MCSRGIVEEMPGSNKQFKRDALDERYTRTSPGTYREGHDEREQALRIRFAASLVCLLGLLVLSTAGLYFLTASGRSDLTQGELVAFAGLTGAVSGLVAIVLRGS